jgi:hypothetical protein
MSHEKNTAYEPSRGQETHFYEGIATHFPATENDPHE